MSEQNILDLFGGEKIVAEALGDRRRIVVIQDNPGCGQSDQQKVESEEDRLLRLIVSEAVRDREVPHRISELRCAHQHLVGEDQVFGTYDVLALPMLPFIDLIENVVVQDDGSVSVVTVFPGQPFQGKPQHQVWRFQPWNLLRLGMDPELVNDFPKKTPRSLRLGDRDLERMVEMPKTFSIADAETIYVEWLDPSKPGLNLLTSLTKKDTTEFPNHWCQIFDVCSTNKYLGVVYNLNVGGKASTRGALTGHVAILVRGTGKNPLSEDHDRFFRAGWCERSELKCDDAKQVILVDMIRRDEQHRVTGRGLMICTNTGYEFYPFVPLQTFEHVHVAMGAAWSWRHTARGIVLSRFPLP